MKVNCIINFVARQDGWERINEVPIRLRLYDYEEKSTLFSLSEGLSVVDRIKDNCGSSNWKDRWTWISEWLHENIRRRSGGCIFMFKRYSLNKEWTRW